MSIPIQDSAISRVTAVDGITIDLNGSGQLEVKGGAVSFSALGNDVTRSIAEAHIGVCLAAAAAYAPTDAVPDYFSDATGVKISVDVADTNARYSAPTYSTGAGVSAFAASTDDKKDYMGQDSDRYGLIGQSFTIGSTASITGAVIHTGTFSSSPAKKVIITIETDDAGFASGTLAHANATWTSPANIQASHTYTASFTSFNLPAGTYHLVIGMEDGLTSGGYAYIQTKGSSATSCYCEESKSGQPRYNHNTHTGHALFASITATYADSLLVSEALTVLNGSRNDVGLFLYNAVVSGATWDLAPGGSTWTHTGLAVNEWAGLSGVTLANAKVRVHIKASTTVDGWAVMVR
jgi:hypothetical protein